MAELPALGDAFVDVFGEEGVDVAGERANVGGGVDEAVRGGGREEDGFEDEGVFGCD